MFQVDQVYLPLREKEKPAHLSGRAGGQEGSRNSSVAPAGSWTGLKKLPKREQSCNIHHVHTCEYVAKKQNKNGIRNTATLMIADRRKKDGKCVHAGV